MSARKRQPKGPLFTAEWNTCHICKALYPEPGNAEDAYNVHTGSQRHKDAVAKAVGRAVR